MNTKIVPILVKNGVSYICTRHLYTRHHRPMLCINGDINAVITKCIGTAEWWRYDGIIETLESVHKRPAKCMGYHLKDEIAVKLPTLPVELPSDAFGYDDDKEEMTGEYAEFFDFYHRILEPQPPEIRELEFIVLHTDCEPVVLPSYVVVEYPEALDQHVELQHLLPCFIRADSVFNLVYDALVKIVKGQRHLTCDKYKNIQVLRVFEQIIVPKTAKPQTREILHIVGTYHDKQGARQISAVSGKNYVDLQQNLQALIDELAEPLLQSQPMHCPKCGGCGIVRGES